MKEVWTNPNSQSTDEILNDIASVMTEAAIVLATIREVYVREVYKVESFYHIVLKLNEACKKLDYIEGVIEDLLK